MSNNKYKILVIEDESNIRSFIETTLETSGYHVLTAATCQQGIMMYSSHVPDLVILDLGLPDADGLEFIRAIREESAVPILVLSARTTENDKVAALDLGANDYVTKPFGTAELVARVRVALRDSRRTSQGSPQALFRLRDLEINYDKRTVHLAGSPVTLTQTEYNILALLSEHAGKVLTSATIIKSVWGYHDPGSTKRLQVNMANIRKKLGVTPGDSRYFVNELGVGYRMMEENE